MGLILVQNTSFIAKASFLTMKLNRMLERFQMEHFVVKNLIQKVAVCLLNFEKKKLLCLQIIIFLV